MFKVKLQITFGVFYLEIIFFALIVSLISASVGGFSLSGWAWIIVFVFSLYRIILFPFSKTYLFIWMPWISYIIIRLLLDFSFLALQFTGQILTPILFGLAISSCNFRIDNLKKIVNIFFLVGFLFYSIHFLFYIGSPQYAMTCVFFCVLALSVFFRTKKKKYLFIFLLFFLNIFLSQTRTGIFLALLAIPMAALLNSSKKKLLLWSIVFIVCSIGLFYTPYFQKKMFIKGSGDFSELSLSEDNLRTSGRTAIWALHLSNMKNNWTWGHGARSSYFLLEKKIKIIHETHNDYIRILYEYGILGIVLFLGSFSILIFNLKKNIKKLKNGSVYLNVLAQSTMILIIMFFGFMMTDNVLLYAAQYGNFMFFFIGFFFSKIKLNNENINYS